MPANVIKYVTVGTNIVNIILLICHISFALLFYIYDAPVLFYFNCVSIVLYLFMFEVLRRKKAWTYIIVVYMEIIIFMIISIIYLGWDYGFQHYCIGFVASIIFTDYYMYRESKISKRTIILVALDLLFYVGLRVWTYNHPYIYKIDNDTLVHSFYITNALIGFSFLIMYSLIYLNTVRKLEYEIRDMANVDSLTGLYNRRRMKELLGTHIENNKNKQLAIAMLDVDNFKTINDTYGHDAGDEVLKILADILREKSSTNTGFTPCRWGGEEFLFIYNTAADKQHIIDEFESIRRIVENRVLKYEGHTINVTTTIGIAFYQDGLHIDELIKTADDNLYIGKTTGRNKIVY